MTAHAAARPALRKKLFVALGVAVVAGAAGYGIWYGLVGSRYVSTDDAYVQADAAQVTPAIAGTIKSLNAQDTQAVKTGDVLAELDPVDAQLALDQANARLASARADAEKAQLDFDRRSALAGSGSVSGEELSNAKSALVAAQATVTTAEAQAHQATVDLSRTTVLSPIDGVVAKRGVQVGQRVMAGTPLMTVVPLKDVYVNANFREVQLRKVKVGQPAELDADLYGSGVAYHGTVTGIAGGTGSAFAVIPAQNATGNWIKVVQRLPVRIALDPDELAKHPLQVGLSMNVTIDTGR